MGQAGSDLPLPKEPGLASSANSDSKSTFSGFEQGHGHPHTVVLEAHSTSPREASGQHFFLGRSSCLAGPFAEQPCRRGWRSSLETPSITELPHNVHLVKKKATFQKTMYFLKSSFNLVFGNPSKRDHSREIQVRTVMETGATVLYL